MSYEAWTLLQCFSVQYNRVSYTHVFTVMAHNFPQKTAMVTKNEKRLCLFNKKMSEFEVPHGLLMIWFKVTYFLSLSIKCENIPIWKQKKSMVIAVSMIAQKLSRSKVCTVFSLL